MIAEYPGFYWEWECIIEQVGKLKGRDNILVVQRLKGVISRIGQTFFQGNVGVPLHRIIQVESS